MASRVWGLEQSFICWSLRLDAFPLWMRRGFLLGGRSQFWGSSMSADVGAHKPLFLMGEQNVLLNVSPDFIPTNCTGKVCVSLRAVFFPKLFADLGDNTALFTPCLFPEGYYEIGVGNKLFEKCMFDSGTETWSEVEFHNWYPKISGIWSVRMREGGCFPRMPVFHSLAVINYNHFLKS